MGDKKNSVDYGYLEVVWLALNPEPPSNPQLRRIWKTLRLGIAYGATTSATLKKLMVNVEATEGTDPVPPSDAS